MAAMALFPSLHCFHFSLRHSLSLSLWQHACSLGRLTLANAGITVFVDAYESFFCGVAFTARVKERERGRMPFQMCLLQPCQSRCWFEP